MQSKTFYHHRISILQRISQRAKRNCTFSVYNCTIMARISRNKADCRQGQGQGWPLQNKCLILNAFNWSILGRYKINQENAFLSTT
jgi:hypothetical protein